MTLAMTLATGSGSCIRAIYRKDSLTIAAISRQEKDLFLACFGWGTAVYMHRRLQSRTRENQGEHLARERLLRTSTPGREGCMSQFWEPFPKCKKPTIRSNEFRWSGWLGA